jgi:U32 family peptidase
MIVPELLMPAGSPAKLKTAFNYGADAVYIGVADFSMRPNQVAFDPQSLRDSVKYTHDLGKKIYAGLNIMMNEPDIEALEQWLIDTIDIKFDALIVADTGAFALVKKIRPDVEIHISTQMSTANSIGAEFWKQAGASRVILARECTLQDTADIVRKSSIEVEVFVHGAMCMAVSGRCLLSAHLCGQSGSKGECKHSCRWSWEIVEERRPDQPLTIEQSNGRTIFFGSTDLCMIDHIPELVKTGVCSLKVEGRMKSEYYVATITRVYRAALDSYMADPDNYSLDPVWVEELDAVSHRPYENGFAFGYPDDNPDKLQTGGGLKGSHQVLGLIIGSELDEYKVDVKFPFSQNEIIEWIGPDMQGASFRVNTIRNEHGESVMRSHCGTMAWVNFELAGKLPEGAILRRRKDAAKV